jgi:ribosome-binding protein aMBF1 (putative translation factor)
MSHNQPADDQDWTPVVMKKRNGGPIQHNGASASAGASAGAGAAAGSAHLRAVEAADVPLPPPKRLSATGKTAIIQGRLAKKWNQDDLNKACNMPHGTINAIEAGKAQPSGAQLNAISRALGVILRFE